MSILIDASTTFIVQGITGREAVNLTRECLDYGAGAQVVDPHVEQAPLARLAEQAASGDVADHVGEDGEDVDAHAAPQPSSASSASSCWPFSSTCCSSACVV